MSKRGTKLLALVLCVAMALSLLCVPAMGATPMMGETAVVETVPEAVPEAMPEDVPETVPETVPEDVGTMPEAPVSSPAVEQEAAQVSAFTKSVYAHNFDNGLTDPEGFFTLSGSLKSGVSGSVPGVGTIKQALKLQSSAGKISFTAPGKGTVKVYSIKGNSVKVSGFTDLIAISGGAATFETVSGTTYDIEKGDGESHVIYIEWRTSHTHHWDTDAEGADSEGWVEKVAATCSKEGTKYRTCTTENCDLPNSTETAPIAKKDHTEAPIPAVPATCVTDGATAGKECSVCHAVLEAPTVVKATGVHQWNDAQTECTVCHLAKDHSHTLDTGTVTKAATCTEDGVRVRKCVDFKKCGHSVTETIQKLGHDLEHHDAQAATCTAKGWEAYDTCNRQGCDYTTYKEIPASHKDADGDKICDVCRKEMSLSLSGAGGWFETIYVETNQFSPGDVSKVSWRGASNGELDADGLEYLVRAGLNGGKTRIDIPGLKAGQYTLTVMANGTSYEASAVEVMAYDRSGYAHWKYSDGVGAYRDDGVVKDDAIILYVNDQNKDTISVTSADGTTVTGIGHILNSVGQDKGNGATDKGGKPNNNKGIIRKLAADGTPLVVRIIDDVTCPDGLTAFSSLDYGGTEGDNGAMARMKSGKNITIEGIGPNASLNGWGLHFMAESSAPDYGKSFEVRNIAFRNVPEDCIGMEGVQEGDRLTASVERVWIHNCSFFVPKVLNPAESDKSEGDGACDFKRGQFMTMSYCYFVGYHKTNLIGASSDNIQYNITWHHNWWENCESRGPLARNANIHIYNCWYDGNSDYAQDARANSYIFSEYNILTNCNRVQVTSKEGGGTIKSFNDAISGNQYAPEGTIVSSKTQEVSSSNRYKSFELHSDESYIPDGNYQLDVTHAEAKAKVVAYAGPMKADIVGPEDIPSEVPADRTPEAAVVLPYDKSMDSTNAVVKGTKDNIIFNVTSVSTSSVKLGKNVVGKDIVFMVDQAVDITVAGTGINLIDAYGNALVVDSGTAKSCPAGIYAIQASVFNKGQYKEGTLTHLTIEEAAVAPHVHDFGTWEQTVDPTCTREGMEKAVCSCGEFKTRTVPMIAHDFTTGVCPVCGASAEALGEIDPNKPVVPVESVTITIEGPITIKQGDTQQLTAVITPADATEKSIQWSTSDETVASVTKKGVVSGKGPGTATITATAGEGKTDTITVNVVGVSTNTYTFVAKTEGPATLGSSDKEAAPDGKYGTDDFFTAAGGNTWRAGNFSGGDKSTSGLLLKTQEGGSLSFTVEDPATIRTLTLSVSSTSSSNYSAVALKDSTGNYIRSDADKKFNVISGTGASTVIYSDLPAGTYTIVAPKGVLPTDVDENLSAFAGDGKNNPNSRGVSLRSASVVTVETVSGDYVAVNEVTLDKVTASLEVGGSVELSATVLPINASNKAVSWSTSDPSVATVADGHVTARKAGTATITARAGGKSATCAVTVTTKPEVKVNGITVTGDSTVEVEGYLQLHVDVTPENATNQAVTWSSSDSAIALVNSTGRVTGVAPGEVTITATAKDGSGVKGTKTVTVKAPVVEHGNLGTTGNQVTWELNSEGELSITENKERIERDDTVFVSLWDATNKFLGVKLINASELTAQVDEAWDHIKLIWVDGNDAPKCDFGTVTHTK